MGSEHRLKPGLGVPCSVEVSFKMLSYFLYLLVCIFECTFFCMLRKSVINMLTLISICEVRKD